MNINDSILVTLRSGECFVQLQTYDPEHGRSQHFYLRRGVLDSLLDEHATGVFNEVDLLNICSVRRIGQDICFSMFWLSCSWDDSLSGYHQTFFVSADKVAAALEAAKVRFLAHASRDMGKAEIYFTQTAQEDIADTAGDKLKRHALRRFFRDHMDYGRNEKLVIQRDEWVKGFYFFSTTSKYEGGIALHKTDVLGMDGKRHPKVYYGLHT